MAEALKLPNMNEFSPGVLGPLGPLLELIHDYQGNRERLCDVIADAYERIRSTEDAVQRRGRASNVLIGMSECGLFDLGANLLTSLGEELRKLSDEKRNERFAFHLLAERHGMVLLDVVRSIRMRSDEVTLQRIRDELRGRGFKVTENEGNASKIRKWMEYSGVVDANWNVDEHRLAALTGMTVDTFEGWEGLTRGQKAFLQTLHAVAGDDCETWRDVSHIKKLCEEGWGRDIFPEGHLRAKVLDPLREDGWIETEGKGIGRGGNAGTVRPTAKLASVKFPLDVTERSTSIPRSLVQKLNTPLDAIHDSLESNNTHEKGLALELLALRIIRDLSLIPVAFRLRGTQTQGAEVDLVAEGVHLHFSRWLFQCKNTGHVELSDLAKEIGMATLLKAHVIVIVTTGRFRKTVVEHAVGLAETTPLQAILIDGQILADYRQNGAARLVDACKRQAESVLQRKRPQVIAATEE